ncbi:hypothetical protein D9M68_704520 [compost metagenome]
MPFAAPVTTTTLSVKFKSMMRLIYLQVIKFNGIILKNLLLYRCSQRFYVLLHHSNPLGIAPGQQQDRPVAAEQDPFRTEMFKKYIHIGKQLMLIPLLPVGLGEQA